MADLIERDALKDFYCKKCNTCWMEGCKVYDARKLIANVPSAIEKETVWHGRWSESWHDERVYSGVCSVCGEASVRLVITNPLPFCPKCGARMDEYVDNG